MAAEAAIAVVSWNTRELLGRCLSSLEPEAGAGRAEVWVVDNASSDGSAELVRERFEWARLVESSENLGYGRAVNLVAARTAAPWIAAANADIELRPGALGGLLRAGAQAPRAGALAPRLLLDDGSAQHSVHPFPTVSLALVFNAGIPSLSGRLAERLCLEGHWDPDRGRPVDWAIGAFLLLRREAFDEIGGFDERQWMYAEDLDLGWRLARAGWKTVYVPEAHVGHRARASTSQLWGEETDAAWNASTYAWLERRRGSLRARLFAAVNLAGAGIRAVALAPMARISPKRWAAKRNEMRRWTRLHLAGLRSAPEPRAPEDQAAASVRS